MEQQGATGIVPIAEDGASDSGSSEAEEEPARGAGFADLAGSSSDEADGDGSGSEAAQAPEPVAAPAPTPAPRSSRRNKRRQKKAASSASSGPAAASAGPPEVSDEALADALRAAGDHAAAEALLAEARLESALAEAGTSASAASGRLAKPGVLRPDGSADSWLRPRPASLEPGAEFLRIFGESSVRAARGERAADEAAGRERALARGAGGGGRRDADGGADYSGLPRSQRRALLRAQRQGRGGSRAPGQARRGQGSGGGGRAAPASASSASGRAAGLRLLGQDAFTPDGGLSDVPEPPAPAAGGLVMRLLVPPDASSASGPAPASFAYEHPDAYAHLQRAYAAAVASYDIDSVFRIASVAPHHVDANLQVCEYFRSIGKLDDAGKALRRALFALERAWHPAFQPWRRPCRAPFHHPANRALHTALWRATQLIGRAGAARTAFALVRLLRSLDPQRDPMRSALAAGETARPRPTPPSPQAF